MSRSAQRVHFGDLVGWRHAFPQEKAGVVYWTAAHEIKAPLLAGRHLVLGQFFFGKSISRNFVICWFYRGAREWERERWKGLWVGNLKWPFSYEIFMNSFCWNFLNKFRLYFGCNVLYTMHDNINDCMIWIRSFCLPNRAHVNSAVMPTPNNSRFILLIIWILHTIAIIYECVRIHTISYKMKRCVDCNIRRPNRFHRQGIIQLPLFDQCKDTYRLHSLRSIGPNKLRRTWLGFDRGDIIWCILVSANLTGPKSLSQYELNIDVLMVCVFFIALFPFLLCVVGTLGTCSVQIGCVRRICRRPNDSAIQLPSPEQKLTRSESFGHVRFNLSDSFLYVFFRWYFGIRRIIAGSYWM